MLCSILLTVERDNPSAEIGCSAKKYSEAGLRGDRAEDAEREIRVMRVVRENLFFRFGTSHEHHDRSDHDEKRGSASLLFYYTSHHLIS